MSIEITICIIHFFFTSWMLPYLILSFPPSTSINTPADGAFTDSLCERNILSPSICILCVMSEGIDSLRFVVPHVKKKKKKNSKESKFPLCVCVCACTCVRVCMFLKSSRCFFDFVPLRRSHGFLRRPHCGDDFVPMLWTFPSVMLHAGDNDISLPAAAASQWSAIQTPIPLRCWASGCHAGVFALASSYSKEQIQTGARVCVCVSN